MLKFLLLPFYPTDNEALFTLVFWRKPKSGYTDQCWTSLLHMRKIDILKQQQKKHWLSIFCVCPQSSVLDFGKLIIYTSNLRIVRAPAKKADALRHGSAPPAFPEGYLQARERGSRRRAKALGMQEGERKPTTHTQVIILDQSILARSIYYLRLYFLLFSFIHIHHSVSLCSMHSLKRLHTVRCYITVILNSLSRSCFFALLRHGTHTDNQAYCKLSLFSSIGDQSQQWLEYRRSLQGYPEWLSSQVGCARNEFSFPIWLIINIQLIFTFALQLEIIQLEFI